MDKTLFVLLILSLFVAGAFFSIGLFYGFKWPNKEYTESLKYTSFGLMSFVVAGLILIQIAINQNLPIADFKNLNVALSILIMLSALFYAAYNFMRSGP